MRVRSATGRPGPPAAKAVARRALLPAVLAALCLCNTPASGQTVTREGSFWVESSGGSMNAAGATELKVDVRGAVAVRGGGGADLAYGVKRISSSRGAAAPALRVRRLGPLLVVEGKGGPLSVRTEIQLRVPSFVRRVLVDTEGGELAFENLHAEVRASTGGGTVTASGVSGPMEVRTGGGEIRVGQVGGGFRGVTGGGGIRVEKTGGETWLETAGGGIFVGDSGGAVYARTGAGDIEINKAAGSVTARTGGGIIRVREADGEVSAENYGGPILVSSARGVLCESGGGGIRLNQVSGEVRAVTADGSVIADLLAGAPLRDSYLATRRGDVTVLIPSNLAVTVEAQNESPGSLGRIVSDFSEIRVRGGAGEAALEAAGALNGGGPVLRITVARGSILLRRQPARD